MPVARKVALVLDALPAIGGAEKVLMDVLELFPEAPVYTLLYNRPAFAGTPIAARPVISSFIERLPWAYRHYRKYLPLMPRAIEALDLRYYELILSFSYAVAHGVCLQAGQQHLSYTFTPMRYAWRALDGNGSRPPPYLHMVDCLFNRFRTWDTAAASRVNQFASVSHWIAGQVRRAYQRESDVIYPPVEVERFSPQLQRGEYYITVSRLVAHKRIDLMVQAFNRLRIPLLVVGQGPERARLERQAGPNIGFLGFQPDKVVADLLGRARAYLCAGQEDFGIATVEAQAAGCPVVAFRRGGALETVVEGRTGLFFDKPDWESLLEAVERLEHCRSDFHPHQVSASAQRFNKKRFLQEFALFSGLAY